MGDEKADKGGGGNAKRPDTPPGTPQDLVDFVDCKSDKVEMKPGKQAWLGGIPQVGDLLSGADIKFEGNADGSVSATAKVGEGAFSASPSVKLKVDGAGSLSVEPDSVLLTPFKQQIDDWANDLNNWMKSKGKKFGKPKVGAGSGKLTLTKENIAAAGGAQPGVKEHTSAPWRPWPNVPVGEKIGAGVLFVAAAMGALAWLPSDTTSVKTLSESAQVPVAVPPSGSGSASGPTAPVIGDACISLDHVPGQYSDEGFNFTTYPQYAGTWTARVATGPGGPEMGTGTVDADGRGRIVIRIFQFGTRDGLTLTGPGNVNVPIGPFQDAFPLMVTSAPMTCDLASLQVPVFTPDQSASPRPETREETASRQVATTTSGGAPWSLLLIPGTAAIVGGALTLDDQRRKKNADPFSESPDVRHPDGGPPIDPL